MEDGVRFLAKRQTLQVFENVLGGAHGIGLLAASVRSSFEERATAANADVAHYADHCNGNRVTASRSSCTATSRVGAST
jgi:hypothetical protein